MSAADLLKQLRELGVRSRVQDGELKVCGGHELDDWVKSGHDKGSSISKWPTDSDLIKAGLSVIA